MSRRSRQSPASSSSGRPGRDRGGLGRSAAGLAKRLAPLAVPGIDVQVTDRERRVLWEKAARLAVLAAAAMAAAKRIGELRDDPAWRRDSRPALGRRARSPRPTVSSSTPGRSGRSSSACPRASSPPPRATRRSAARRSRRDHGLGRACRPTPGRLDADARRAARRCGQALLRADDHDAVDDPRERRRRAGRGGAERADVLVRRVVLGVAGLYALLVGTLALLRATSRSPPTSTTGSSRSTWAARPPPRAVQHDQPPDAARRPRRAGNRAPRPARDDRRRRAGAARGADARARRDRAAPVDARPRARRAGWVAAVGDPLVRVARGAAARAATSTRRRSCRCSSSAAASFSRGRRVVPRHGRERVRDEGGRRPHVRRAGLVLAWSGRRRLGVGLAVGSVAWSAIAVFVVLPAFGNALQRTSSGHASRAPGATRSRTRSSSWFATR